MSGEAMLPYQHAYHAGNAADVHEHVLLSVVLAYMARKAKPLTYMRDPWRVGFLRSERGGGGGGGGENW